jgi:hypothetical protein
MSDHAIRVVLIVGLVALFALALVVLALLRNVEAWPARFATLLCGSIVLAVPTALLAWGMGASVLAALGRSIWLGPAIAVAVLALFRSGGRFPRRRPIYPPLDRPSLSSATRSASRP